MRGPLSVTIVCGRPCMGGEDFLKLLNNATGGDGIHYDHLE